MRKLAIFAASFTLAAAVYVYLVQDTRALWLAGVCLALSVLCRWLGIRRVSVAALGTAVGLLWCFGYHALQIVPLQNLVGANRTVCVQLTEIPRQTAYGASVEGTMDGCGVIIYGDESLLTCSIGDRVTVQGSVAQTSLAISDEESLYLRSKGLDLCVSGAVVSDVTKGSPALPQRLRIWLQTRISLLYEGEAEALLRALITGDQSGLDYAAKNELAVAGLRHAVAVSGMHVSMLLFLVMLLCGGNPRLTAIIGIPVAVGFALMTGASPSVCRAAVMQIMFLSAPLVRREQDPATTLGLAALLLLLENPWSIASVSFQLSFAAMAGLFVCTSPLQQAMLSLRKKPGRVYRMLVSALSSTFGATMFTVPISLYYFRMISVAAPLTNFLTLWAVTGAFSFGLASCFLGSLGVVPGWIASVLSGYILHVCGLIAAWPFAAAYGENPILIIWAVGFYVIAALFPIWYRRISPRWMASAVMAAFLICILASNRQFFRHPCRITVLDVGQGQCLLIRTEDVVTVVDCGGSYADEAGETLARTLLSAGVTRLDTLIVTHYDADHVGGIPQLMERIHVELLVLPKTDEPADGLSLPTHWNGETVFVENFAEITVPNGKFRLYPSLFKENENNQSVSVLATVEEYDILITGDLDRFAEMRMISHWNWPDVDLLVAGHHGASDSTDQVLLDMVRPETAVISVGAGNSYGHPSEETIQRITASGAEILRTDQLGTITLTP